MNKVRLPLNAANGMLKTMMKHGETPGGVLAALQLVQQALMELEAIESNYDLTKKVKKL